MELPVQRGLYLKVLPLVEKDNISMYSPEIVTPELANAVVQSNDVCYFSAKSSDDDGRSLLILETRTKRLLNNSDSGEFDSGAVYRFGFVKPVGLTLPRIQAVIEFILAGNIFEYSYYLEATEFLNYLNRMAAGSMMAGSEDFQIPWAS